MDLKSLLRRRPGINVVKAPDIKLGKYWSFEMGNYWDTVNRKPTKDYYFGLKFTIDW